MVTTNQCHIIAEVTGSSPVSPTIVSGRQNSYFLSVKQSGVLSLHCTKLTFVQ